MSERLVIRSIDDLDRAVPRLVPYAPAPGSVIVIDEQARPVAVLTPEILTTYAEAGAVALGFHLQVFAGRGVFVYTVTGGDDRTAVAIEALAVAGATVLVERTIEPVFFGLQDDREAYLAAGGQKTLDEAYDKAQRVVAGTEGRD